MRHFVWFWSIIEQLISIDVASAINIKMKKLSYAAIASLFTIVAFLSVSIAHAALTPTLNLNNTTGTPTVQVTVIGADPNAPVTLYYPAAAGTGYTSINIGTTNSDGNLSTNIDSTARNISPSSQVYVSVDGAQSPQMTWPGYTGGSGLTLSQTTVALGLGQSSTVTASASVGLTLSSNSNPSVAGASISGNQITITSFAAGTTNISICASNIGCGTVYVSVQTTGSSAANISFSQTTVNMPAGQTQQVTMTGSGGYYISSNSNQAIASANINGPTLTIGGVSAGSTNINVCSTASNATTCGTVIVNVSQATNNANNTNNNGNTPTLLFGQSNVTLSIGQTQTVPISGAQLSIYYISTNSSPSAVSANVSGTNLVLTGVAYGGTNITVCAQTGGCGNVYAYVPPQSVNATNASPLPSSVQTTNSQSPTLLINGSSVSLSGGNGGVYTGIYSVQGTPVQISLNIANVVSSIPTLTNPSVAETYARLLEIGSTGLDVTALQNHLTSLGLYSGPITGKYGGLTMAAVKKYQAKLGLKQVGVVGPATLEALNRGR